MRCDAADWSRNVESEFTVQEYSKVRQEYDIVFQNRTNGGKNMVVGEKNPTVSKW